MLVFSVDVRKDEDSKCYELAFPAFDNAVTCTSDEDPENVLKAANEWLSLNIASIFEDNGDIPEDGYGIYPLSEDFEQRIYVCIPGVRISARQMTKVNLTIPRSLRDTAIEVGLNISEVLREALTERIYEIKHIRNAEHQESL